MIKQLQKMRAKRGFTLLELIVVIAVIAALLAVILPSMGTQREVINSANAAARDFYAAIQTTMSKFSTYDGQMSPAYINDNNLGVMRYYPLMGGNYPYDKTYDKANTDSEYPARASLYIMVHSQGGTIRNVGVVTEAYDGGTVNGLPDLLQRRATDRNTEFGRLLAGEIKDRISFRDGYYYARADFTYPTTFLGTPSEDVKKFTIKVQYTAFCQEELPKLTNTTMLTFGSANRINYDGRIVGTCSTMYSNGKRMGDTGTQLN